MPERVFRVSPVLCVVGEDGKVVCKAGSATEAVGMTRSNVNSEIASAKATKTANATAAAAANATAAAAANATAAAGAETEVEAAAANRTPSSLQTAFQLETPKLPESPELQESSEVAKVTPAPTGSELVPFSSNSKYESIPLNIRQNFEKFVASLTNRNSQTLIAPLGIAIQGLQSDRVKELLVEFNKLQPSEKIKTLEGVARLKNIEYNKIIETINRMPSGENILSLFKRTSGGRKTRTTHKRHKASKKTRKAQ
jgi:hypothetical protein